MVPDFYIRCAARAMLRRYGTDASLHAAQWAAEFEQTGDDERCALWCRVHTAIGEFANEMPMEAEAVF